MLNLDLMPRFDVSSLFLFLYFFYLKIKESILTDEVCPSTLQKKAKRTK